MTTNHTNGRLDALRTRGVPRDARDAREHPAGVVFLHISEK